MIAIPKSLGRGAPSCNILINFVWLLFKIEQRSPCFLEAYFFSTPTRLIKVFCEKLLMFSMVVSSILVRASMLLKALWGVMITLG